MRQLGWVLLVVLLIGCGHDEGEQAYVRVFNGLYNYSSFDLYVDTEPQLDDLPYAAVSPYIRLKIKQGIGGGGAVTTTSSADGAASTTLQAALVTTSTTFTSSSTTTSSTTTTIGKEFRTFSVFVDSLVTSLIEQNILLLSGEKYTLFAFDGLLEAPRFVVDRQVKQKTLKGKLKIRVASMGPAAGSVDVYIVKAGQSIVGAPPLRRALLPSDISEYFDIDPGQYDVILARTLTKQVVHDSGPIDLLQGSVQTMVVYDAEGGGQPLQDLLLTN